MSAAESAESWRRFALPQTIPTLGVTRGASAPGDQTEVAIDKKLLEEERDALKEKLRQLEAEQRKVEAELKQVRQRELRTKREIEALTTLIELVED